MQFAQSYLFLMFRLSKKISKRPQEPCGLRFATFLSTFFAINFYLPSSWCTYSSVVLLQHQSRMKTHGTSTCSSFSSVFIAGKPRRTHVSRVRNAILAKAVSDPEAHDAQRGEAEAKLKRVL